MDTRMDAQQQQQALAIRQHLIDTQAGIERFLLTQPLLVPLQPSAIHPLQAVPRIVIRQMLSLKASNTIIARAEAKAAEQGVSGIADLSELDLISCGCSRAKAATITRFAESYYRYPDDIDNWQQLDCETLLKTITSHKGLGLWTASIVAMFHFAHEDLFPLGDSSLRKAVSLLGEHGVILVPERAAPYRTYLASYLWQLLDQARI
ncbi:DNA-3-methyladenine glycosylase family protein [Idiomarina xiamenensis]|uniref:3-methyladenine DNA glycosylase n=1 Tax=Idiomarina xiamenensis 10-D-4 TaxID=740709 RepID=K2KNG8_9GAMM|nr:3-methyladenine DNA glycosylase [Idiomarina xiamenensis]EKE79075.1 3-methyladenine DNA glycosylase [Idiomarina xiamenensis 10-D-4]